METARALKSGGGRDGSGPDVLSGLEDSGGSASGDDRESAEGPGLLRGGSVRSQTVSVRLHRHRRHVIAGRDGEKGGRDCAWRPAVAACGPARKEQWQAHSLAAWYGIDLQRKSW